MNPVLLHLVGLTLLHFVWQGTGVAFLLWMALRFVPVPRADIRYGLALLSLAALVVCPIATFVALRAEAGPVVDAAFIGTGQVTTEGGMLIISGQQQPGMAAQPTPVDFPTLLTFLWATGVVVLAFRLAAGLWRAHAVTRRRTSAAPHEWQERLAVLAEELGIKRPIKLIASSWLDAPATVGVWRAVVLVPCSFLTKLPDDMVEALLLHELAHIRRHDYLMNVVQTVVETVLFYHPAVWWVSHVVRAERENCCDDIAVRTTGNCASYARALTMLEERRTAALAVSASGGHLMKRIRRILSINTQAEPAPSARPAALVVTVAALALAATVLASTGDRKKHDDKGPDVQVTKGQDAEKAKRLEPVGDIPEKAVAMAAPTGDIGSINRTVKESDYKGVPVPVIKLAVMPDFVLRKPGARKGEAVELTYALAKDGQTAFVYPDGRAVSAQGVKTEIVTAIPGNPQGSYYVIALPGGLLKPDPQLKPGTPVLISYGLAKDGSALVLYPVHETGQNVTSVRYEGAVSSSPIKTATTANIAPRGKDGVIVSSGQYTLAPVPAGAPVAIAGPATRAVKYGDSVAVSAAAPQAKPGVYTSSNIAPSARPGVFSSSSLAPQAKPGDPFSAPARITTNIAPRARAGDPVAAARITTSVAPQAKPGDPTALPAGVAVATAPAQAKPGAASFPARADEAKAIARRDEVAERDRAKRAQDIAVYQKAQDLNARNTGTVVVQLEDESMTLGIKQIAQQADINVLIEPGRYEKVTFFSRTLAPEEALKLVVRAARGTLRREGNSWIVSPGGGSATTAVRSEGVTTEKVADINLKNVAFPKVVENMAKLYNFDYVIDSQLNTKMVNLKMDRATLSAALTAVCHGDVYYHFEGGKYYFSAGK